MNPIANLAHLTDRLRDLPKEAIHAAEAFAAGKVAAAVGSALPAVTDAEKKSYALRYANQGFELAAKALGVKLPPAQLQAAESLLDAGIEWELHRLEAGGGFPAAIAGLIDAAG